MYNIELLTSFEDATYSLIGLVGLRQTSDPEYPTLPPALLESRSKRYLQDQHTLLNISNIDQCAVNFDHFDYTAYSAGTQYTQGDKVSRSGSNYEYINPVPSTGNTPPNTTYWRAYTPETEYLLNRQKQAVTETLDDCFNEKKTKQLTKTVFNEISLFTGNGNVNRKEINAGKFVGFQIKMIDSRGLMVLISRIGVQVSGTPTFNVYVYHSSQVAHIATVEIVNGTANSFQWTSSEIELRFLSADYDSGGTYIIGYYQDDLGVAQAILKDYNWGTGPCGDCNQASMNLYKQWSQFIEIDPFEIASGYLNGTNLPNLDHISYNYSSNYGLNLNLSVRCDLTSYIKENELQLAQAIGLKWALLQLNDIAYNVRSNKISEMTKQLALMEMDVKKHDSIVNKYERALKAMSIDFSSLDPVCMPCDNKYGVSFSGM